MVGFFARLSPACLHALWHISKFISQISDVEIGPQKLVSHHTWLSGCYQEHSLDEKRSILKLIPAHFKWNHCLRLWKKIKQCEKIHRVAISHRSVKTNLQKDFWYHLLTETCSRSIFPFFPFLSLNNKDLLMNEKIVCCFIFCKQLLKMTQVKYSDIY